jgi:hypothetical protein
MSTPIVRFVLLILACSLPMSPVHAETDSKWQPLFNGRDLSGWTPKIVGYPAGENFADTFIVRDGAIRASYQKYDLFKNRFGHLFYNLPFRYYRLRLKYRFLGPHLPDTPDWAISNSGIMFHGQSAESMALNQAFPVSIELQLLGRTGPNKRPTANVCTPGTTIYLKGKREETHCVESGAPTITNGQWVRLELDVLPNGEIVHRINGKEVLRYDRPELDLKDADALKLIARRGGSTSLHEGTISLQSEGHPIEFKEIEIRPVADMKQWKTRWRK